MEGLVIVLSILLAFGIDAKWASLQDRAEERAILTGLREDMEENRRRLNNVIEGFEHDGRVFAAFYRSTPDSPLELPAADSGYSYRRALAGYRTFDPMEGTLESVISSGKLHLLQDAQLRALLGSWRRRQGDVREEAEDLVAMSTEMTRAMFPHGGYLYLYAPPDEHAARFREFASRARRDSTFLQMAILKQRYAELYQDELLDLSALGSEIIARLETHDD